MKFGYEPGYVGAFTRNQADGALRNGAKIFKVKCDPEGDFRPVGSHGVVLGSISVPEVYAGIMYFVEWDDRKGVAVGCIDWKIAPEG